MLVEYTPVEAYLGISKKITICLIHRGILEIFSKLRHVTVEISHCP
jgi:hypothetical protein